LITGNSTTRWRNDMIAISQFYTEEYFAYREVYYAKLQEIQNDHEI